jgi:redox-sensing transcriptional repressor
MEHLPAPVKHRLLSLLDILENVAPAAVGEPLTAARLEALTGWPSNTIRKDISYLGGAAAGGAGGTAAGYAPDALGPAIKRALGLDRRRRVCVVGLGRLGSAYLNSGAFAGGAFELAAGFDTNVNRTEILSSTAPLYPAYKMGEVVRRFGIEIALLCVPAAGAQAAVDRLAEAGVRGILNFAPAVLAAPAGVVVRNVNVVNDLRALAVQIIDNSQQITDNS